MDLIWAMIVSSFFLHFYHVPSLCMLADQSKAHICEKEFCQKMQIVREFFFLHKKNEFSTSHAYKSARISLENVKCSCTLIWLLLHRFRYTIYSCVFVVAPSQSWFIINSITDLHHKILFKACSRKKLWNWNWDSWWMSEKKHLFGFLWNDVFVFFFLLNRRKHIR